jgi:hypothetical protein
MILKIIFYIVAGMLLLLSLLIHGTISITEDQCEKSETLLFSIIVALLSVVFALFGVLVKRK